MVSVRTTIDISDDLHAGLRRRAAAERTSIRSLVTSAIEAQFRPKPSYDPWLEDPRVGIRQEPFELEMAFRAATHPVSRLSSPKALGDCYLLAVSQVIDATLVTFDQGLASACQKARQRVGLPIAGEICGSPIRSTGRKLASEASPRTRCGGLPPIQI